MSTPPHAAIGIVPRQPADPVPDLTDYHVVHRAMVVDFDRLATAAAELVDRPDPARLSALRWYLRGICHEVESHHHVEDSDVWPVVVAAAGEHAALVELTDDHGHLDPLLHRTLALAADDRVRPELATVLREVADLLARHIEHEERDVFPLITAFVRVEDWKRLQERFRSNLKPGLLPFVVPWAIGHATPAERAELLGAAPWPMHVVLRIFQPRFRAREAVLFR